MLRLALSLLLALTVATVAQAQSKGYVEVPTAPAPSPGMLEITEFFMYSCPHCAAFSAELEAWRARLPRDVVYRRVPVMYNPALLPHSQMYYALEALGRTGDLHGKVFKAVQVEKKALLTPAEQADFLASLGVDRMKYLDAYQSPGVQAKARQVSRLAMAYRLDGVPALAVNGRYLTTPAMAGGNLEALRVADQLVAMVTSKAFTAAPVDDPLVDGMSDSPE